MFEKRCMLPHYACANIWILSTYFILFYQPCQNLLVFKENLYANQKLHYAKYPKVVSHWGLQKHVQINTCSSADISTKGWPYHFCNLRILSSLFDDVRIASSATTFEYFMSASNAIFLSFFVICIELWIEHYYFRGGL